MLSSAQCTTQCYGHFFQPLCLSSRLQGKQVVAFNAAHFAVRSGVLGPVLQTTSKKTTKSTSSHCQDWHSNLQLMGQNLHYQPFD